MADAVSDCGARVYPVGRLDLDSEGLLLLTNDGALMQHLLHPPASGGKKTYHVTVFGDIRDAAARLAAVTDWMENLSAPPGCHFCGRAAAKAELAVTIHQGKNRQIRRMCAQCGWKVQRLRRVREAYAGAGRPACRGLAVSDGG